ncbi:fumarate hydratase, partial [Escherichia sp. TWPC-MK]
IGSRHPNPKAAELELRLEEGLNRLGIGPQGLTGNSSVMGVHIESAARHPSTIGVAPALPLLDWDGGCQSGAKWLFARARR